MNNIPRSPVKSKKISRASPHQRAPTVNDISMQSSETDMRNKVMTTKAKSKANLVLGTDAAGNANNINSGSKAIRIMRGTRKNHVATVRSSNHCNSV